MTTNITPDLLEDYPHGLPATSESGYPMAYLDTRNDVLCHTCANVNQKSPVAVAFINFDEDELYCDRCNGRIESAYAEGE